MSYNGSGTFQINSSGQPVVTGTVISSTAFNALTADLATGLSTAITKDGQTTTTVRVPFAQGISSTLVTDATSATTGSIITAGGISCQKALWVGTTSQHVGAATFNARITQSLTASAAEYALRSTGQTTGWIAIDMANTGGDYIIAGENSTGNNLITGDSAYDMVIRGPSGISFSANAGASQHMRLTSTGLLGIGMTPTSGVGVAQALVDSNQIGFTAYRASSFATTGLYSSVVSLQNASSTPVAYAGVGGSIATNTAGSHTGNLIFAVAVGGSLTEAGRFGSDKSFLVGTTTNEGAGIIAAASNIIAGRGAGANSYMLVEHVTGSISGSDYIWFRYNGTQIGGVAQSGTTAVVYNTTSDQRLKTVLKNQRDWRKAIANLWVGEFDKYTTFEKTGNGERHFGVLAQQANDALDGLGITKPTKDDDVWMASAEPFAFLALWGVKDLYAENEALRARVAALEAKVN